MLYQPSKSTLMHFLQQAAFPEGGRVSAFAQLDYSLGSFCMLNVGQKTPSALCFHKVEP